MLQIKRIGLSIVFGFYAFGQLCAEQAPQFIGKISIVNDDIFDTKNQSESKNLYRLANALHIQTHRNVIKRELLFKEGDIYDPELIAETERNLRRFKFLRRVTITSESAENNTVNLTIHTRDTWTLEPQFTFSRVGNQSSSKVGILERNLWGTGKRLGAFIHHNADGTQHSFSYRDQQLLGTKLTLNAEHLKGTDFEESGISFSKPFTSSRSKSSFELSYLSTNDNLDSIRDGREIGHFNKRNHETNFSLSRSFGSTSRRTQRGTVGYRHTNRTYDYIDGDTSDFLKPPLNLSTIETGFEWQNLDYISEKNIETFDRLEDFNLGSGFGFLMGGGQNWTGIQHSELVPSMQAQIGKLIGSGQFFIFKTNYHSRIFHDKTDNLLASTDFQYFKRMSETNTLAAHLAYDHGYRLDPEDFLLLGEDSGLHGYSVGQFSGERRFLFNLEDRWFLAEDILHLFSFGTAVFFDSGYAWDRDDTIGLSDLRNSIGLGFRLGLSRSSRNEPIRFDLSYALNNNQQNSRLIFSVRSGIKFGAIEERRSRRN